ncbi:Hypothetical protein CINCED_3A024671 [Cinara cedri]|uniref:Uncharacterized protein n=1 Tax=Cinara cedri TaxID=506608 RepID=A0A5E4M425_9HEMI|nr:Hypothetical protein CINCED_3A024671 [Cinara cedri]
MTSYSCLPENLEISCINKMPDYYSYTNDNQTPTAHRALLKIELKLMNLCTGI